ncbi:unnamed protein product, partial [Dovyalis caffra]
VGVIEPDEANFPNTIINIMRINNSDTSYRESLLTKYLCLASKIKMVTICPTESKYKRVEAVTLMINNKSDRIESISMRRG